MKGMREFPDRKAKIAKRYDKWSTIYDKFDAKAPLLGRYGAKWRIMAVRELKGCKGTVLDMGCGTGKMLLLMAKECPSATVIGVDISEKMVNIASEKAKKSEYRDRIIVKVMDCTSMDFDDESIDCAFASYTFTSATDPEKIVVELSRVLKRGGRVVILDWGRPICGPMIILYPLLGAIAYLFGYTRISINVKSLFDACEKFNLVKEIRFFGSMGYILVYSKV